ncbi:MAG: inner membrane protein [Gammaproteobacteria bacterium]|jgi:inner membrane protein
MFIAHVPSGYLIGKLLLKNVDVSHRAKFQLLAIGLFSSVLPDFDLSYFYLIDKRQHTDHSYWAHIPIYSVFLGLTSLAIPIRYDSKLWSCAFVIVLTNTLIHCGLNTVAGGILWLAPFDSRSVSVFHIPSRHSLCQKFS